MCGAMTAAGADPEAGMTYTKIIGEKEKAVESLQFDFPGVYRPAIILAKNAHRSKTVKVCPGLTRMDHRFNEGPIPESRIVITRRERIKG